MMRSNSSASFSMSATADALLRAGTTRTLLSSSRSSAGHFLEPVLLILNEENSHLGELGGLWPPDLARSSTLLARPKFDGATEGGHRPPCKGKADAEVLAL